MSFTDDTGQSIEIYFKMEGEHSYLSLSAFINEAVKLEIMSYSRAYELIGEDNAISS